MPTKMSRSAPRPPFRLRDVSIAVRTLRLSCLPELSADARKSRIIAAIMRCQFTSFHDWRTAMKALVNICIVGLLALIVLSSRAVAQTATHAEIRLKELNITLPSVPPPVANYVELGTGRQPAVPCGKYRGS